MKTLIVIFILFLLVTTQCNKRNILAKSSEYKKETNTDSITDRKQNLIDAFEKQRLKNEQKYDDLKIISDSIKNKSSLSGFIDSIPVFNEIN